MTIPTPVQFWTENGFPGHNLRRCAISTTGDLVLWWIDHAGTLRSAISDRKESGL